MPTHHYLGLAFLLSPMLFLGHAEQHPTPDAKAETTIDDFAWLAGPWRGEGFGGVCEEVWSHPLAGTMMGSFRLVQEDQVSFYELMVLGEDDKGWSLKVKHFSKDFVAWETKKKCVRFALESVGPNAARFSGLTIKRDGDALRLELQMRMRDGTTKMQPFHLRRHQPK